MHYSFSIPPIESSHNINLTHIATYLVDQCVRVYAHVCTVYYYVCIQYIVVLFLPIIIIIYLLQLANQGS